jgi:hypothetical protein
MRNTLRKTVTGELGKADRRRQPSLNRRVRLSLRTLARNFTVIVVAMLARRKKAERVVAPQRQCGSISDCLDVQSPFLISKKRSPRSMSGA